MTASYEIIDYSLRPAKFAERKMLCDFFSRLRVFGSLESYRYVGFGSIWFSDCVLFHRTLGISDIVSIECELDHQERFEFNNPLRGIRLLMGEASDVLPTLDWSLRSIVWLDYDDPLNVSILEDVRTVASRAKSGTAFVVSVQAEKIFDKRNDDDHIHVQSRDEFSDYFGEGRTPEALRQADLRGWTLSKTSRQIVRAEIEEGLKAANAARPNGQKIEFRQTVAFEYKDGAKMTTIGGVFVDQGQAALFDGAGLRELEFFRDSDEALRIHMPLVTPHEMRHLDRQLPILEEVGLDAEPIPVREANRYAKFYRYLPNFASFER
ncbi:hypothetical protein K3148_00300 [Qipengyuania aurantiaca]|uniref:Uncharacterized protein n=1 Tax=Qipengyuania aurantiaca TaxID=2867233 RepID=A0ABX8ZQ76_9SPHN|nr:O-methyltransferase [Qipengyuania aurantiaca]QZD89894.1 hypothetical protein K3148_00300 [Qipengyuania aurantiaca]